MIGRTISRFRIVAKLGEGGMGSVWKAEDPLLERHVALKFLPESLAASSKARQRFLREARAASGLNHPGVATVFDAGEADGLVYIAMLHVDGETVTEWVTRQPLTLEEAVRIALEAAEALEHAHSHGVLHRDVTGRNIMIARDGQVVVVDFGLALPEEQTRLTLSGTTLGTVGYLAPEVAQGGKADRRSDLYGLGVVLYQMLTGELPFRAARLEALLYATVHQAPDPPSRRRPGIPEALDRIVLKALEKNPERRYQRASDFIKELRVWAPGLSSRGPKEAPVAGLSQAPTIPIPEVAGPVPRVGPRRIAVFKRLAAAPWLLAVVVAAVIASIVGVWRSWETRPAEQPTRLAVLPLQNLSADPAETDYLAEGISRMLITKLTQVSGLRVTPWVTARRYSDLTMSIEEIAEELNVDALIVGTVEKAADRIQGSISLVETDTGFQTWAEDFRESAEDIFEIPYDVAAAAVRSLKGRLSVEEEEALAHPPSQSAEAYDHYLKGAHAMQGGSRVADEMALAFFRRAVAIDTGLAEAHTGIGAVQMDRYFYGWGGQEELAEAEASFRRAIRLDPALLSARAGLIRVYWERGLGEECLKVGKAIAGLGDGNVEELFVRAQSYTLAGLPDKAVPLLRQVVEIDPVNEGAHWFLVFSLIWANQPEESIDLGEEFLTRFGENPMVYTYIAWSFHILGEFEPAAYYYRRAIDLGGEGTNGYTSVFAAALYRQNDRPDEARAVLEAAVGIVQRRLQLHPDNTRMRSLLVFMLTSLGDRQRFLNEAAVLRSFPPETETWMYLAIGHMRFGEAERASEYLRRAQQQPTNPTLIMHMKPHFIEGFGTETLRSIPGYEQVREAIVREEERMRALY